MGLFINMVFSGYLLVFAGWMLCSGKQKDSFNCWIVAMLAMFGGIYFMASAVGIGGVK